MDTLIAFLKTRSHPWTHFLMIHNQFLDNSSRNDPPFWYHFVKLIFSIFLLKMCPNSYFQGKCAKICLILTVGPNFFFIFSPNDLQKKNLTEKTPIVLSCSCPSTPVTAIRWILIKFPGFAVFNCTGLFNNSDGTWSRSILLPCHFHIFL